MEKQIEMSPAQQEAINTIDGQVILISCPGSGKTSTVVRRVKHMVESGIDPSSILVLTFSKAAALEMKTRYKKLCAEDLYFELSEKKVSVMDLANKSKLNGAPVYFSTIHSFCYQIISKTNNYSIENIIQENDEYTILQRGIKELQNNKILEMKVPDLNAFTNSIINEISKVKNNGCDWNTYKADSCPTKDFKAIFDMYETEKINMGKIDFDDMLLICLQVFNDKPDVLKFYQSLYRYIIIDEFQDTNFIQRDILYKLAGDENHANICVVGDDDQSIYKFRGAQPQIMLDFPNVYPHCRQINMDINYRSQPEIINAAKNVISQNENRFSKDIKPNKTGHGIVTYTGREDHLESALVNQMIKMSHDHSYDDMAVLYRNNSQAGLLSTIMLNADIPFHSSDFIPNPYTHWIFYDLMSFYRLANGNGSNQDLINVINKPNRYLPVSPLRTCRVNKDSVRCAVMPYLKQSWQRGKAAKSVNDFFLMLDLLRGNKDPLDFINMVESVSGYFDYLKEFADYKNEDVSAYSGYFELYERDIVDNNLDTFDNWMKYIKQFTYHINEINEKNSDEGVTLSTMHKSKGLEWPVVFILGADDGIIPSKKGKNEANDIEEERRLFYVAITRAMDELHIFYTKSEKSGKGRSCFVDEMQGKGIAKSPKYPSFQAGMRVEHKTGGAGRIVSVADDAVVVQFDSSPHMNLFQGHGLNELTVA